MGLLIPEVFILLLTDVLFVMLLIYALPSAVSIAFRWDMTNVSEAQYNREKRRYLISTIIFFVFALKIPLFLFYIYTNDKMANVLTGAMCAAGSINATIYGSKLFILKVLNIYLMTAWLTMYKSNNSFLDLPFTRLNYRFLLLVISLIIFETVIEFLNFSGIDPTAVVSCCSSIYSSSTEAKEVIARIDPFTGFYIFIFISVLYLISTLIKKPFMMLITSALFLFFGWENLISFTSTYVYELPSHKCPFCILQKEYGYIGYLFYISLFISTASSLSFYIYSKLTSRANIRLRNIAIAFALIFIFLSLFFPLKYFFINKIWL